jgi:hypothetical protein
MGKKYYLNIWDDFSDDLADQDSSTHIQVETDEELSLSEQKAILEHFLPLLQKNLAGVKVSLDLYDTKVLYPQMNEQFCALNGFKHYQQYQLQLEGITHDKLDNLMDKLSEETFTYQDKTVIFISES